MERELALIQRALDLAFRPTTISVLILDSSESMLKYGDAPRTALEGHINALREQTDRNYLCAVVGFHDYAYVIVPLTPVGEIEGIGEYSPDHLTLLWETVAAVLQQLLDLFEKQPRVVMEQLRVVVGVFSDGGDNRSREGADSHVRQLARKALLYGWTLNTFGIGIDAAALADKMGFPTNPSHAQTVEATETGVHESVISMTMSTVGGAWRPRKEDQK
jgi:hypothetical protein